MIKPYSSFRSSQKDAFPALKFLLHADDYVSGATWTARTGQVVTLSGAISRDADGVYSVIDRNAATFTGPISPSKYAVIVSTGKSTTFSSSVGLTCTIGQTSAVSTSGIVYDNNNVQLSAVGMTGAITYGKGCAGSYYDLIDTTSPNIFSAQATNVSTDIIANGSGTTISTNQIVLGGPLSQTISIGGLSGNFGQRCKLIALFDFSTPLSFTEFQLAIAEMARTGELYAGWRNKA